MRRQLHSLDQFYGCETEYDEPDRYRDLLSLGTKDRLIAQGAGISYVPASFGEHSRVVSMRSFDRILGFDHVAGTVEVEAGTSLGKLFRFLLPHKLGLAVQPGYPQITVGGCIAFNIHGKNQFQEGLFDSVVLEMRLFHPDKGILRLSRTEMPELFWLTLGGFGLTGIVLSAVLRVAPLPGRSVKVSNLPTGSLSETMDMMGELKGEYDLLYSWNDLSLRNKPLGRGFICAGRFNPDGDLEERPWDWKPLATRGHRRLHVFRDPLMPLVNRLHLWLNLTLGRESNLSLFDYTYPVANKIFYFYYYGRAGFLETQMLIPDAARQSYVEQIERLLVRHGLPVYLATVKAFQGAPRQLNYSGSGFSLGLDLPSNAATLKLFENIDALNTEHGAIGNIAKDSRLCARVVRQQYPQYNAFREALHSFDPRRAFTSELSERLEL